MAYKLKRHRKKKKKKLSKKELLLKKLALMRKKMEKKAKKRIKTKKLNNNKQKGKMQRLALNTISEHLTPKLTSNKDSWIVRRDLECREIDVLFKENILQELHEGTSDTGHLDGIESRLNLICRDTDTYKQLWWIADKHTLRDDLVKLMKGLDWKENTSFEKVYLITKEQMFDGWVDVDELSVIDLKTDVLN